MNKQLVIPFVIGYEDKKKHKLKNIQQKRLRVSVTI